MQSFGLRSHRASNNTSLELAIVKEQASALGRVGRTLRLSLERYQAFVDTETNKASGKKLIQDISENVWALILQREFLGFIEENLEWVVANYHIPKQALQKLGSIEKRV